MMVGVGNTKRQTRIYFRDLISVRKECSGKMSSEGSQVGQIGPAIGSDRVVGGGLCGWRWVEECLGGTGGSTVQQKQTAEKGLACNGVGTPHINLD